MSSGRAVLSAASLIALGLLVPAASSALEGKKNDHGRRVTATARAGQRFMGQWLATNVVSVNGLKMKADAKAGKVSAVLPDGSRTVITFSATGELVNRTGGSDRAPKTGGAHGDPLLVAARHLLAHAQHSDNSRAEMTVQHSAKGDSVLIVNAGNHLNQRNLPKRGPRLRLSEKLLEALRLGSGARAYDGAQPKLTIYSAVGGLGIFNLVVPAEARIQRLDFRKLLEQIRARRGEPLAARSAPPAEHAEAAK
ncbi:MAG: hypothetical protein IT371_31400 [Deltaproteobacteria bacterium]|nr:hypothetical protein [Deltaproteobacteria bacterium]